MNEGPFTASSDELAGCDPRNERCCAPANGVAWGSERWLFFAGLGVFAFALALRRLGDFDLPWHLATGRVITQLCAIPRLDPLSFTHHPLRYVEPLTDVPLYWLSALGGAPALQAAGGIVGALIGLALAWQLRSLGPIAFATSALALSGMSSWLVVRPATWSFLLIALELGTIELHRRFALERRGHYILVAAPLCILLWANAHGFASIGAGLFACYALYRVACRLAHGRLSGLLRAEDASASLSTTLAATLALVASTLNVAGPTLRFGPSRFASDAVSTFAFRSITEFAPPTLDFFLHLEPLGASIGILALLGLAFGRDEKRRWSVPTAFDSGCVFLGGVGLVWMVRTVPLSVLVVIPVVARRFASLVPSTVVTRWALATSSWLAAGFALVHVDARLGFGFDPAHFPERAVTFIEGQKLQGRMWNFSPFGGYLAWRLYPEHLVFMDGRNDQARDIALVLRSAAAMNDAREFSALVSEFDLQYAVISAKEGEHFGTPLAQSSRWTMVEYDDVAAVYVRNDGPNADQSAHGYRVLRHLTALSEVLQAATTGGRLAPMLRDDGRLAISQDSQSARAAFIAACGELAVRDFVAFDGALARLARLSPGHPAILVLSHVRSSMAP